MLVGRAGVVVGRRGKEAGTEAEVSSTGTSYSVWKEYT